MRKLTIVFGLFLCVLKIGAQDVPVSLEEAAKKKVINGIKKTEVAVYADVYEVAADDEAALRLAQHKSVDMLQARVIEQVSAEMNMSKEDIKAIFDVIDDKCQNIVIKNSDVCRVFTYIVKDKVGLTRKKLTPEEEEEYFGEDAVKKMVNKMMDGQDSINYVLPTPETKDTLTAVVAEETIVVENELEKKEEVKKEEGTPLVKILPAEPVTPEPAQDLTPVAEVVVPQLCQKMIATKNFDGLMTFLKKEKAANTLMWGNANKMQRHELCYIVAIDRATKEIVAVLDKGDFERMNFMNKQMDHARNYKGTHSCVYVQEY